MADNIIRVAFGGTRKTAVIPKTKLDYGQKLEFVNLDLPETFEADFCNTGDAETKTVLGQNGVVEIPDEYLQTGKDILCFLYLHYTPDSGQTQYTVQIPVTTRPDRTEETPTPVEQSLIEQALAALNDGVERAEAAAELLENPAAEAETLESGSDATADYVDGTFLFGIPKGEKGDPFTYEDFTEEQKQELVDGPILDAQTAAVNAVGAAGTTAVGAVNQAGSTQVAAVNQAGATQIQAVEDKGDEVIESIPADYTQLSEDVDELKNATNQLELSKAPVITDTASGAIASFPDGAENLPLKKLVAQIDPVQDLHGQDAPYPPGGGKNKFLALATNISGNVDMVRNADDSVTFTGKANGTTRIPTIGTITNLPAGTYIASGISGGSSSTYRLRIQKKINGTYTTLETIESGEYTFTLEEATDVKLIGVFSKDYTNSYDVTMYPMIRLASVIDPTFAPYSNLCPISGWTGLEGQRTGKNLLPNKKVTYGINCWLGTDTSANLFYLYLKPGTYTISANLLASSAIWIRASKGTSNIRVSSSAPSTTPFGTFTVTNADYYRIWCNGIDATAVVDFQLELGSTASDYSTYTAESLSVNWQDTAGTVYGGSMTVYENGSGELVAEYAKYAVTSFGGVFGAVANGYCVYAVQTGTTHLDADASKMKCNIFKYSPLGRNDQPLFSYGGSSGGVTTHTFILPSTITSLAEANAWLADNPIECTLKLATPIIYTFSNLTQLTTLLGTNNIWADTGDTTVEYRADTKRYIDKKIAEIVNS